MERPAAPAHGALRLVQDQAGHHRMRPDGRTEMHFRGDPAVGRLRAGARHGQVANDGATGAHEQRHDVDARRVERGDDLLEAWRSVQECFADLAEHPTPAQSVAMAEHGFGGGRAA